MELPEQLQQKRFVEWNYLVKGLVQMWELARMLQMERYLEQQLQHDTDGKLSECLGNLGHRLAPFMECRRMLENLHQEQSTHISAFAGAPYLELLPLAVVEEMRAFPCDHPASVLLHKGHECMCLPEEASA